MKSHKQLACTAKRWQKNSIICSNIKCIQSRSKNWDSSINVATGYGLDNWMIGVQLLAGGGNFSL
jgi:hypothetical protein